jgi:uncharacterized protein YukE
MNEEMILQELRRIAQVQRELDLQWEGAYRQGRVAWVAELEQRMQELRAERVELNRQLRVVQDLELNAEQFAQLQADIVAFGR